MVSTIQIRVSSLDKLPLVRDSSDKHKIKLRRKLWPMKRKLSQGSVNRKLIVC